MKQVLLIFFSVLLFFWKCWYFYIYPFLSWRRSFKIYFFSIERL